MNKTDKFNGHGMYKIEKLKPEKRISWNKYFLDLCKTISVRSLDENTKVGCVVVDERNRIVSTGYNSFPAGVNDSKWPKNRTDTALVDGFKVTKYDVMAHAELNAIASTKEKLVGYTLYCTYLPCAECAKAIITSGIKKIVYSESVLNDGWNKHHALAVELFKQASIELLKGEK